MEQFNRLFRSFDWALMYGLTAIAWLFSTISRGYVTVGGEALIPALYIIMKYLIREVLINLRVGRR